MAPEVLQLSQEQARRIAVRAQLLAADRPRELLDVIDHLGAVQISPTDAVAPSQHLVLWSRLGPGYQREELDAVIAAREVVEWRLHLHPAWYVALLRAEMLAWPDGGADWQRAVAGWVEANDRCRRDILAALAADGPTPVGDLPDTCEVPWQSSGWTNDKSVQKLLDCLEVRGEVAVSRREGGQRLWDLAERVFPDEPAVPADEARRRRNELRLRALGIARAQAAERPVVPDHVGDVGVAAVVEGVRGSWRVDPAYLDDDFEGRAAVLSPLDHLVMDRRRMEELFGFDYQLEMYKPKAKRRWGYFALPILWRDELVGKVDATSDRKAGVLRVAAVHEDVAFTRQMSEAVEAEIDSLADWLELDRA